MSRAPIATLGTWLALLRLGLAAGITTGMAAITLLFWLGPGLLVSSGIIAVLSLPLIGMVVALYLPADRITHRAFYSASGAIAVLLGTSLGVLFFGLVGGVTGAVLGGTLAGCASYMEFSRSAHTSH